MATEKQIAANRRNSLKSTGPRTESGKAIASRNAGIATLFTATIPIRGESRDRFSRHVGALIAEYRPSSTQELDLVHRLAVASWRQMRIWSIESAAMSAEVDALTSADPSFADRDPVSQAAAAYRALANRSQFQRTLNYEESRLDRQFYRAWEALRQVQKEKNSKPNAN